MGIRALQLDLSDAGRGMRSLRQYPVRSMGPYALQRVESREGWRRNSGRLVDEYSYLGFENRRTGAEGVVFVSGAEGTGSGRREAVGAGSGICGIVFSKLGGTGHVVQPGMLTRFCLDAIYGSIVKWCAAGIVGKVGDVAGD